MTLLEKVRRFAERRRQILLDRLKSENEVDTKEVQWQGYNSDGHAIVKNNDKTEVVDGQGLTSNRSNKSLILDKAGTVEYKKKAEPPAPRPERKPVAAASSPASKKKSSLLTADPSSEFSLAIIKKQKEVAIDVICIAVIDENDGTNTNTAWANFRATYPERRFFLLRPNSGYGGTLFVPSAFGSDPKATFLNVSNSADWYSISGLNNEPLGAQCILFIDQSGSMDINTVITSYNSFKSNAIARQNKVAVVDNASEDYITPFYISDDTFRTDNYVSNWPR